ncbi:MAG: type II toxin-antitoxin system RelE/ParE family toxin [Planctomycetes bacterium]|nr:type II toxin-antitoxin system RelE/ParE family toxin [Planctomycetota bacterium]
MPFDVDFSRDAERQLKQLSARDQRIILDAIDEQLRHQPDHPTRNRKLLRENPFARWELRVRQYRVLYDILEMEVIVAIIAIAEKTGSQYLIEGREFPL